MKKVLILSAVMLLFLAGCAANKNNMDNNLPNSDTRVNSNRVLPQHQDLAQQYSQAIIHTNMGDISLKLYGDLSPITVNNFLNLAQEGFYDGTLFHRVIPDFMIQAGDPLSRDEEDWNLHGVGGPGYTFADEINDKKLVRGSLAMANSGPNTNGSQFFIVTAEATYWLDGLHTNFGEVVSGMDVVDAISLVEANANNHPLEDVIIESIELK